MRLVDLSHPLTTGMTTFPGDPAVEVSPALELARDGCAVAALRLGTHSGTHVDAPSHVVPGGASLDQLDLSLFTGPAVVVDVRGARPRERIGWEPFAEHAGRFGPGVVVLVRTGWDVLFDDAEGYRDQPWLAPEVAERLVAAGVRTLGVDALSPDETGDEELRVHRAVLRAGGVIAENLRDLGAVPSGPGARPWVSLLPLRVAGGDGAPVRAVAWDAAAPGGSGVSGP